MTHYDVGANTVVLDYKVFGKDIAIDVLIPTSLCSGFATDSCLAFATRFGRNFR